MNAADPTTKSADQVLDEAAAWIEQRDREQWAAVDQAKLDAWLAQSPANFVAFLRADHAWSRADRLNALRTEPRNVPPNPAAYPPRCVIHAAAALVLVAGLAAMGLSFASRSPSEKTYATPVGGHAVLTLADGSKIELNTNTSVRISNDGAKRLVKLDRGEAFFDIRHDVSRPFVVLAAVHRVVDIGTKFVVRERGTDLEISLLEGSAKVKSTDTVRSAVLSKGDVAIATATELSVHKPPSVELVQALAWRRRILVFDNTSLAQAAAEFNRYNAHKLIIADAAVARLTIAGSFHANDVRAFAEVAEDILHVRVKSSDANTVISR